MEHLSAELCAAGRKFLAGLLFLILLVAFWADRPVAAASLPDGFREGISREEEKPRESQFSLIGLLRKPWLGLYRLAGAPRLDGEKLTAEEETQFTLSVSRLMVFFFVVSCGFALAGQRVVASARRS